MNVLLSVLCVRVVFVERWWGGRGKQDCDGKKSQLSKEKKHFFLKHVRACTARRGVPIPKGASSKPEPRNRRSPETASPRDDDEPSASAAAIR